MRDYDDDKDKCDHIHDCEIENKKTEQKVIMSFLSGIISLGLVLVLGSYGYTWSETKSGQEEKREWRKEHQAILDKRFDALERGQDKIERTLDIKINETKDMLQQILNEQQRVGNALRQLPNDVRGHRQ